MSKDGETTRDFLVFAKSYFAHGRLRLVGVLVLEMLLKSIHGAGLLLILPLLGLLGIGSEGKESALWERFNTFLNKGGLHLNLETGLLLFIGVIAFRAILFWVKRYWQVDVEQKFQMSLRTRVYEALAHTEMDYLQNLRFSEFVQAAQIEIRNAQRAASALLQIFSDLLNLVLYFSVALILSVEMTFFAVLCGGTGALVLLPYARQTHRVSRRQIRHRFSMLDNFLEHIQGMRMARTLGLTDRFIEDFRERNQAVTGGYIEITRLSARAGSIFQIISAVLLASIVYAGLVLLDVESARLLVLLAIIARTFPMIGRLQIQVQEFISLNPSFRHYLDFVEKLEKNQETPPLAEDGPGLVMHQSLELRNVSFRYQTSKTPALKNISLTIEKSAFNAIGGHSGAGKSTLADIATGLVSPQEGELRLDGKLLSRADHIRWRRETGVVPQESFLFNDTVRANLLCVNPEATDEQLWEVLEAVNSRGFVESSPEKLDRLVGERGSLISSGERQRLSIARALLRKPQLLVLDEPTNNLDEASESALFEILEKLSKETTLLVVSHDQRLLERSDRLFMLENGVLVSTVG